MHILENIPAKRAIIAAVQLDSVSDTEFESSLAELADLAFTLGLEVVGQFTQKRATFDATAYIGVGKREEIKRFIEVDEAQAYRTSKDASLEPMEPIEYILLDHEISPSQLLNLENEVGCEVMDRTVVILEIFHRNANSHASKLQVEMARLNYMAPRLREAAKREGPTGRQRSGAGGRGTGQSRSQMDSRKVRDRLSELQKELDTMAAGRDTQRARRQEQLNLTQVALVGYTNAGKSTIMRALTKSEVLVADQLFATLDTKVRILYPETVPRVLVSDTVGFIKNLPHGLLASFKSTLDEALGASLLLHVVDASDPGFERQLGVTDKVLAEIGADTVPKLLVFNKIDGLHNEQTSLSQVTYLKEKYPNCIVMSALNDADVTQLHQAIVLSTQNYLIETEVFLSWAQQDLRGEIYSSCDVIEERTDDHGVYFKFLSSKEMSVKLRVLAGDKSATDDLLEDWEK